MKKIERFRVEWSKRGLTPPTIERNPATAGEYVVWPQGRPIRLVRDATHLAIADRRAIAERMDDRD